MTVQLVQTALLRKWEVADVGKDNMINKHICDVSPEKQKEIMASFLRDKTKEMPKGFRFDLKNGYELKVTKIQPLEGT